MRTGETSECQKMSWAQARTASSISGRRPRIWFQVVPERKAAKNRLHVDISVSGGRAVRIETRRQRVDSEAARLADLGALLVGVHKTEGLDHYAVTMKDPEGNEFDIN
jgi:hypothetical protein